MMIYFHYLLQRSIYKVEFKQLTKSTGSLKNISIFTRNYTFTSQKEKPASN